MTKKKGKGRKEGKSKRVAKGDKAKSPATKGILTTVSEKVGEHTEALKYVSLFFVFCATFYLVFYFLTLRGSLSILNTTTASILGAVLSLAGMDVIVNGPALSINGFGLEIIDECTAIFSSIVYCSAVLAYPTTLKNKSFGIAFGVPSLYAINILRLSILALVGVYHPDMFEFVHVYLWQASFIIFVVVIFLLWLKLLEKV